MLYFFRRIRKALLSDGATSKYLLYAVGEIALVVIGILIALQINNWNEERKENVLEENLFTQLYKELQRNQDYFQDLLNEGFMVHEIFVKTILIEGNNLDIDSFINKYRNHWPVSTYSFLNYIYGFTEFFNPKINTYSSSVSDGTISLIKDKEFVYGLESIYGESKDQLERIYKKETEVNKTLQMYISNKYGFHFEDKMNDSSGYWDESASKSLLQDILDDGEFRFQLSVKHTNLNSKRRILESIVNKSNELIDVYELQQ